MARDAINGCMARRGALRLAMTAMLSATWVAQAGPARAQTASDVDALNLMLNVEYLLAQFLNTAIGTVVPIALLAGGGQPGVDPVPGQPVTFTDPGLRAIVREMAADNVLHLLPIRVILGGQAARQPLIDISAGSNAPFSVAMQRAGIVAAGTAFNPYASEENLLYALFLLKGISVAAYRGLAASVANRVVTQNFAGLLGTEAVHAATIRSYLYRRGAATPRLRANADAIAAFQRSLNGGSAFQGVTPMQRSYAGGTTILVANTAPAQATGEVAGRSAGQTLNQLYLTNTATPSGGFFPQGVNGTIRTSASA